MTCSERGWEDRRTIDGGGRERLQQVDRAVFLLFFFLRSSKNFRFAFLALNVSSQYFTWKILICSAKSNHVLRCSLSGELATGRARLRTGDWVASSQVQLTWVNRKSSALPSVGFVPRLESRSWKVRLGLQSYSICRDSVQCFSVDFQNQDVVGKIFSCSKRACFAFVHQTTNGWTASARNLPTHRFRDWS